MEPVRKTRTIPMQVLALGQSINAHHASLPRTPSLTHLEGMSRSGTESMRTALETLGYKRTYHGVRDLMKSKDGLIWSELTNLKYGPHPQPITSSHFDQILGDCAAVTDMPCCAFWSHTPKRKSYL